MLLGKAWNILSLSYELISISPDFLHRWLPYAIAHKVWYSIKQKDETKPINDSLAHDQILNDLIKIFSYIFSINI